MPTLEQMTLRQGVLAEFGDFALRCESLDEVLHEACRLVADALGADLAKVLEIEEGGATALVKAGVGWRPGIVGRERLPFSERSSETYSLKVGEPVISRDIREEERFEFADFLIQHGVVSLVNVPILLPGGKAYGLLQVDSRKLRDFGKEDIAFLRVYATILGPVIDRLQLRPFLSRLVENLCDLYEPDADGIRLEIDIADVDLAPEAAVPIGLIANEFVTNSLKHAFGDEGGTIAVSLDVTGHRLRLCLSDDGKGLPPAPHAAPQGSGTGIRLIEGLAGQLDASTTWPATDAGTVLCLEFHRSGE